jgi:hypothetical protein
MDGWMDGTIFFVIMYYVHTHRPDPQPQHDIAPTQPHNYSIYTNIHKNTTPQLALCFVISLQRSITMIITTTLFLVTIGIYYRIRL